MKTNCKVEGRLFESRLNNVSQTWLIETRKIKKQLQKIVRINGFGLKYA
jgi:hypothetical protein